MLLTTVSSTSDGSNSSVGVRAFRSWLPNPTSSRCLPVADRQKENERRNGDEKQAHALLTIMAQGQALTSPSPESIVVALRTKLSLTHAVSPFTATADFRS